jgi:DNA-binding MarR family transcriptional regulator
MRDTSRLLLRMLQSKIEPHGITLSQYFILRELWEFDGLTLRELAVRVRIADPSIATNIDGLEESALVKRERSDDDRRRVHVYLTATGRSLRSSLLQYAVEINADALKGISLAEIDQVQSLLKRVKDNLNELLP